VLERIASNLSHQNPGIVLSTIRIIIKYLDYISNMEVIRNMCRRVSPVLVTLMTCDHEFQYVVLKNINIIIQKRPMILEKEIKMFFCHYNDPHYIKLEKLEILLKLSDDNNIH
jgi:vesicle coat complex subunit